MACQPVLTGHAALNAICDALGIDEHQKMQKMVIEIEIGQVVKVYTRSLMPVHHWPPFVKAVKDMTVTDDCNVIVHEEKT